ncbi:FRIGIDA-like protein 4a [Tripterygium wilfordii]|uniref:FRIGIDA-like protein n=1 Tax=Tripterygium wilfordii TaxID=458696 RepID=A0A7J7CX06_TRIWF|nr:FRIGIDA-like protein 4a [Tripterygium wilfordii]KAF5738637.1 FRIGIDA-like protein 4a [Tripterygium wilfordii]
MGSIPDPGELTELTRPSFDEFQRQTSLMTSCTLLWKELSDHFTSLEQNLQKKSEALRRKIRTLDCETKASLDYLKKREVTIDGSVEIVLDRVDEHKEDALKSLGTDQDSFNPDGEVDDGDGMMMVLKDFCLKMDSKGFWKFLITKKKELDTLRSQVPVALAECVDPPRFVLEAMSEVFPVDRRAKKSSDNGNDLGWACVVVLESLIPVMVDPLIGKSRLLVTPSVKERAKKIADAWKASLEERGGIENVKTPDVHTFLQHLVTFGIVKSEDLDLYRKLVVGSAWRKQMPRLAISLGLGDKMPEMIQELISRGQQLDAVHFTHEFGLVDKFPPVPLLKAYLRDAKKAAASIIEDPNNTNRAAHLAARKEQSALQTVIKCIEEYKLEAEFPVENLKKRLEQLEKTKTEKKRPAAVPANKRTRASNGGPMPPAKAGRLTNAYVSSFPAPPAFVRSPSHTQYHVGIPTYPSPPAIYGNRSPPSNPYAYSPEAVPPPYAAAPIGYPAYGGYGNGLAPAYQQAYYR